LPSAPAAQNQPVRFADIQPELEANLAALSDNIEQFEAPLVRNERLAMQSAITRLNRCSELLRSVTQK
jgi:hypothetical protein